MEALGAQELQALLVVALLYEPLLQLIVGALPSLAVSR